MLREQKELFLWYKAIVNEDHEGIQKLFKTSSEPVQQFRAVSTLVATEKGSSSILQRVDALQKQLKVLPEEREHLNEIESLKIALFYQNT